MKEMFIKRAGIENAVELASLGAATFYESFASQNTAENMAQYLDEVFTPENIKNEIQDSHNVFFMLYIQQTLCGYAKVSTAERPVPLSGYRSIELGRIYVTKACQGKGGGKKLLQHCITFAKDRQYQKLWLGVWEHNNTSIAFYERFGFTRFGEHIFQLGNDPQTDWLMQLDI